MYVIACKFFPTWIFCSKTKYPNPKSHTNYHSYSVRQLFFSALTFFRDEIKSKNLVSLLRPTCTFFKDTNPVRQSMHAKRNDGRMYVTRDQKSDTLGSFIMVGLVQVKVTFSLSVLNVRVFLHTFVTLSKSDALTTPSSKREFSSKV